MKTIKLWRFEGNVYEGEGKTLVEAFYELNKVVDFYEKCADFDYDELAHVVKCGYLTLGTSESYDISDEDEDGNITYYSYTDDGIEELLFRAKDGNNYNYVIIEGDN